jgi:hypothetical protein
MKLASPAGLQRHTEIPWDGQLSIAIHAGRVGIYLTSVRHVPYEGLDLGPAARKVFRESQVHRL